MRNLREWIFRIWYWYVNSVDKNAEVLFMNYGYSNGEEINLLQEGDKKNRYSIQLYHLLANAVDLKKKHILEVGSGRGGGLAYVDNQFKPESATGMDLDKNAVSFSKKFYKSETLDFVQGDAQMIPLESNRYHVVMNVESSHRYQDMRKFLSEVYRVLQPGGHFLFTDFRYDHEIQALQEDLKHSGLTLIKEEDITEHVVKALELDDNRRRNLVKKLAPRFLHSIALNFAGTIGSSTYNQFYKREYVYMNYVLQKN
ncbi:MAG: class I SAM-dependent methyltransferase [Bacteroidales bacterium]|nr:class I SAM-dependent methyltransferase [Bacteroidales bacterium]